MIVPIATLNTGIAAIPSVGLRSVPGETPATSVSTIDRFSSIVDLSGTGQLLSAVSATRNRLAAIQETPGEASSSDELLARAQSFVDTFNALRSSVAGSPTVSEALPGSAPGSPLSATANDLASTALAAATANFDALRSIGISLQALPSPAATANGLPILSIDQNAVLAAGTTDPAGTRTLIDQAALSLSEQLSGFEGQVADASVLQARLSQLGSATALNIDQGALSGADAGGLAVDRSLLQQLPADTVLNNIRLDLAATGPNATAPGPESALAPNADLLASTIAELSAGNRSTAALSALPDGAANSPRVTAVSTDDVNAEPAIPVASSPTVPADPAVPVTTPDLAPAVLAANADAIAAERQASAATLALQNLLANPSMRAFNVFFDPAYAAVIAAAHLMDFVPRTPVIDPKLLGGDQPGPVMPVVPVDTVEKRI